MKIYVIGRWKELVRIKRIMRKLEALGHTITCDWTDHNFPDSRHLYMLTFYAQQDLQGILKSEITLAIATNPAAYMGTCTELGASLAVGHPVVIVGHGIDDNIFINHPLVKRVDKLSRAFKFIEEQQKLMEANTK